MTAVPMKYPAMQHRAKMSTDMVCLLSENMVDADEQQQFENCDAEEYGQVKQEVRVGTH